MKCKKINGVDKSICTAEQKIAYNYAFSWSDICRKTLNDKTAIQDIEKNIIENIKHNGIDKKYNIDAILIAFRSGFEKYCKNPFIAYDYDIIGKCFSIPFEIA